LGLHLIAFIGIELLILVELNLRSHQIVLANVVEEVLLFIFQLENTVLVNLSESDAFSAVVLEHLLNQDFYVF
jgi:hypothetical protein